MGDQNQPLDHRAQTIADVRALLDFLAARPDVPIYDYNPLRYPLGSYASDADGMAELQRIADALGVPVTGSGGRAAGPDETHFTARLTIGSVFYEAVYIRREHMDAYDAELKHVREEFRVCGCGTKLTDAEVAAGKRRCTACVPGEAVESTPAPVLHIRQIGASRHNLCGGEIGGEATHASAATCPRCVAVLVEAEPKFAGRTAVES